MSHVWDIQYILYRQTEPDVGAVRAAQRWMAPFLHTARHCSCSCPAVKHWQDTFDVFKKVQWFVSCDWFGVKHIMTPSFFMESFMCWVSFMDPPNPVNPWVCLKRYAGERVSPWSLKNYFFGHTVCVFCRIFFYCKGDTLPFGSRPGYIHFIHKGSDILYVLRLNPEIPRLNNRQVLIKELYSTEVEYNGGICKQMTSQNIVSSEQNYPPELISYIKCTDACPDQRACSSSCALRCPGIYTEAILFF